MGSNLTVDQVLQKYQSAMSRSDTKDRYIKGIQGYQGNPMEQAAAAQDKWAEGVQRARDDGTYRRKLLATPRDQWSGNAVNFGANQLGQGAKKAETKMRRSLAVMVPAWNSIPDAVASMANVTDDDKLARVRKSWEIQRNASKSI